jgi:hypothetical protein
VCGIINKNSRRRACTDAIITHTNSLATMLRTRSVHHHLLSRLELSNLHLYMRVSMYMYSRACTIGVSRVSVVFLISFEKRHIALLVWFYTRDLRKVAVILAMDTCGDEGRVHANCESIVRASRTLIFILSVVKALKRGTTPVFLLRLGRLGKFVSRSQFTIFEK